MRKNGLHLLPFVFGAFFAFSGLLNARVITYPGPAGISPAPDLIITADDKPVFVYETHVNFSKAFADPALELTPIAYFDFDSSVTVVVNRTTPITSAVIRPLALNINPVISGSTLSFALNQPAKLSIEFNGDLHRALHLFADSIEANPAHNGDPGVRYFGPGVYNLGEFQIADNQTVYIAGGAFINGQLLANGRKGVVIRGRGIINGSTYPRDKTGSHCNIELNNSTNPTVDGVICLDPPGWGFNILNSTNVLIQDVKYIGCRQNSDGISLQSCRGAKVSNCFVRAWDDAIVVKNYGNNTSNIQVQGCLIWNDLAQCFEIGYETRGDTLRDVSYLDCTVLHALELPVVSIHNGDRATILNIRYENITVEHANIPSYNPYIIDLWIGKSMWSQDAQRGRINGVYIKNVAVLSGTFVGNRIAGYDATHLVENVTIENFIVKGKPVIKPSDANFTINNFTSNIRFLSSPSAIGDRCDIDALAAGITLSRVLHGSARALAVRAPGGFLFELFSLQGKLLLAQHGENRSVISLDQAHVTPGMYIVKVRSNNAGRLPLKRGLLLP